MTIFTGDDGDNRLKGALAEDDVPGGKNGDDMLIDGLDGKDNNYLLAGLDVNLFSSDENNSVSHQYRFSA